MKLQEFKNEKLEELETLIKNNLHLFPIDLYHIGENFELVDKSEAIFLNNTDLTIEYEGEDHFSEYDPLNVEDICYIIDIIQGQVDDFEKTESRTFDNLI